jgi:PAS domain S-box-containing protein
MLKPLKQLFSHPDLRRQVLRRGILWTLVIAVFIGFGHYFSHQENREIALSRARDRFRMDVITRLWVAQRGGVYVPLDEKTSANPHLKGLPDRDITTSTGKVHTLVNPAYLTRMLHELGKSEFGLQSHITSLNPLRPDNAADAWEQKALKSFEAGTREYLEELTLAGRPHLRFMGALVTTEGCLGCHAAQGYKVGDVRGGISVTVPMDPGVTMIGGIHELATILGMGAVWLIGLGVILIAGRWDLGRIAEHERDLAALRNSEQSHRNQFARNSAAMMLVDPDDGTIIDANDAAIAFYGHPRDRLLAMNIADLNTLSAAEIKQAMASVSGSPGAKLQFQHRRADGSVRDVEVSSSPILAGGRTILHSIIFDITERKRTEESLRQSEYRFRLMFEDSPIGIWEEDFSRVKASLDALRREGIQDFKLFFAIHPEEVARIAGEVRILDINSASVKTLNAKDKEQILRDLPSFFTPASLPVFREELIALATGETRFRSEIKILDVLGKEILLDLSLAVQPGHETSLSRVLVTFTDITERKRAEMALRESEGKFRIVADHTYDWEYWVLPDGKFVYVSPSCERISGYRAEEFREDPFLLLRVIHPEDQENFKNHFASAASSLEGFPCQVPDFRILARNGEERWIAHLCQEVFDDEGNYLGRRGSNRDVTDRKKMEDSLKKSEVKYQNLFEQMTEGFVLEEGIYDADGDLSDLRFLNANAAFEQQTGLKGFELIGRTVRELFPGMGPQWLEPYQKLVLTGDTSQFEIYGEAVQRWFEVRAFQTAPTFFGAVFNEITERKASETVLRESEAKYRALVSAIPDLIFINSRDGEFLAVHAPHPNQLFAPAETFLHRKVEEVMPKPFADRFMAAYAAAMKLNTVQALNYTLPIGREQKDFEARVAPCTEDTTITIVRDVTGRNQAEAALRASEERFQKSFHSSPVIMTLSEITDGRYIDVNERFCSVSGFTREEAIGKTSVELGWISTQDRNTLVSELQVGGRIINLPLNLQNRRGDMVHVLYSGEVLEIGGIRYLLSIATDITETKRGEEKRQELESQVQHLQKLDSLGRLAGGVAHDMNNVLASIMAVSSLLKHKGGETALQADLLLKACHRGRDLVKGLLGFARKDVKDVALLDLNDLARREVDLLSNTTLQKFRIQHDLQRNLPKIFGDESALANALMNLCVNALDAMPDGGTLTLRTRTVAESWVQLIVEDSGQGMTEEVRTRALEPFFTTKPLGKGTGLGLSMVFGTMKAHGGTVEIHSKVGEGTQVALRLPTSPNLDERPAAVPFTSTGKPSRPLCILLVDDDPLVRAAVPPLLQSLGHSVEVAESGVEALRYLGEGMPVDLLLLDLNMPGVNGESTLWRLRRTHPDLPVFIASGYMDEATWERLGAMPMVSLLPKPYGLEEIQNALSRLD